MTEKRSLISYLEASSRVRPDAPAVEQGDRSLTYSGLEEQARRLAATLHSRGIGPGSRVGLLLDKSVEAVVALHGVLAAGAAYVPLDAKQPAERLGLILRDCGIETLISRGDELRRHAGSEALRGVKLSLCFGILPGQEPAGAPAEPLSIPGTEVVPALADSPLAVPCPSGDDDLAYVLYTSGSTGQPKGVMLSHRAAMAFVDWAVADLGLRPDDRLASQAAFTFDLSILDLLGAAASGAAEAGGETARIRAFAVAAASKKKCSSWAWSTGSISHARTRHTTSRTTTCPTAERPPCRRRIRAWLSGYRQVGLQPLVEWWREPALEHGHL